MRVLACDGIHQDGLDLFRHAGWDVEIAPEPIKDPATLAKALADVDAVLVRSATKVPAEALAQASRLKVIGRAGAGVDTIDVDAATARGIAVMNAPDGNTLAAAEHAGEHAGERHYVGRRHVRDPQGEPVVLDWSAPLCEDFYQASPGDHRGLATGRA